MQKILIHLQSWKRKNHGVKIELAEIQNMNLTTEMESMTSSIEYREILGDILAQIDMKNV